MQCNAFFSQILIINGSAQKIRSSDLSLVLDLIILVSAELLTHVSRHKTTLGRLALGLLDDGPD
jgi:hypothetical protein